MKTELKTYTVAEICENFVYSEYEGKGVTGLNGQLIIQPEYQRHYIYDKGGRDVEVIKSIMNGYPLGIMYFNQREDGKLEILDGQQRVTSIGRFMLKKFTVKDDKGMEQYITSLPRDVQERINSTSLLVYICEGTESEIKSWFQTVNIAGVPLKPQELRNAIYSGPFVTLAKEEFSNSQNANVQMWAHFLSGDLKRQDYLETALDWIALHCNTGIDEYMGAHRHDDNIRQLKAHFDAVIEWINNTFLDIRPEMRGLNWGALYERHHAELYSPAEVKQAVDRLFADDAVTEHKGIFEYVLGGEREPRLLNIRIFDKKTIAAAYERQTAAAKAKGISNCPLCASGHDANRTRIYKREEMDADHVTAWSRGGATAVGNCQMLCRTHNHVKGNR